MFQKNSSTSCKEGPLTADTLSTYPRERFSSQFPQGTAVYTWLREPSETLYCIIYVISSNKLLHMQLLVLLSHYISAVRLIVRRRLRPRRLLLLLLDGGINWLVFNHLKASSPLLRYGFKTQKIPMKIHTT